MHFKVKSKFCKNITTLFFATLYNFRHKNIGKKQTGTEGRIRMAEKIENWRAEKLTEGPKIQKNREAESTVFYLIFGPI